MKVFAFLVCCLVVVNARDWKTELKEKWEDFKMKHQREYGETEHEFRFKIFSENLMKIYRHNQKFEAGETTYRMGVNSFTDLLHSEFAEKLLMKARKVDLPALRKTEVNADLPDSFDWREKGAVTKVKDQGNCGSCWAFSTTGCVESMNFIKNGELIELSEQNLMDCTWDRGNHGCNGGEEYKGLDYVKENGGIDTEESYPYEEKDTHQCRFDEKNIGAKITSYETLKKGDEEDLKRALATEGPVSIAVDVEFSFQHYESGVYEGDDCNPNWLNHAILAVGYGVDADSGKDYWIVKNSWGAEWGEEGYIRIARNANNMCGVASECYVPQM